MKEIIERIKVLRRIRGYSYENMATGLNISVSAYRKIEKNETNLTVERLIQIAKLLKTSAHQLIDINGFAHFQQGITENEISFAHHNSSNQHPLNYKDIHTRILHLEDQFLFLTHEFKLIQQTISGQKEDNDHQI
ncbi:MAG: helix-turn-helix transcriptional regulator [Paludibacter sp.]|nr:helix-turn-helix transcriptional regulator [Paludibacter sp.]